MPDDASLIEHLRRVRADVLNAIELMDAMGANADTAKLITPEIDAAIRRIDDRLQEIELAVRVTA